MSPCAPLQDLELGEKVTFPGPRMWFGVAPRLIGALLDRACAAAGQRTDNAALFQKGNSIPDSPQR